MTLLLPVKAGLTAGLIIASQFASIATADNIKVSGQYCPAGYTPTSYHEVRQSPQNYCSLLNEWDIARLSDGGSLSGSGYQCGTIRHDDRSYKMQLGHTLCSRNFHNSPSDLEQVLLEFGWRNQYQLNRMSSDDKRNTLITELNNYQVGNISYLQSLTTPDLVILTREHLYPVSYYDTQTAYNNYHYQPQHSYHDSNQYTYSIPGPAL